MYLARSSPTVLTWFMDASSSGLQRPHSGTPRPPGASTPSRRGRAACQPEKRIQSDLLCRTRVAVAPVLFAHSLATERPVTLLWFGWSDWRASLSPEARPSLETSTAVRHLAARQKPEGATYAMPTAEAVAPESRSFEADVAKLLQLMVHSVYSDRDVFLRELISNAADACERLRFEAIAKPALLGDGSKPRITLLIDAENRRLTVEDNGIGMSQAEMVEGLGTIARSGTRAFMDQIAAAQGSEGAQLIGQFGVGFYSAFMVADRVDVVSRRAGSDEAVIWSSDGQGAYTIQPIDTGEAPACGTRVILHLKEDAASYTERYTLERIVRAQSGHVPVPIVLVEKPGAEPHEVADGAALWVKPRAEIKPEEYTDLYRSVAGQFDEPALTVHFRAEGRHEYTVLGFVPGSKPFDLFDPDRAGRMKLYVKPSTRLTCRLTSLAK